MTLAAAAALYDEISSLLATSCVLLTVVVLLTVTVEKPFVVVFYFSCQSMATYKDCLFKAHTIRFE